MVVRCVKGSTVDGTQHTLTGLMAETFKLFRFSPQNYSLRVPEVVSIDRNDELVSSGHSTLGVDTEGGVSV